MNYWKITNKSNQIIKFAMYMGPSASKGIMLGVNQFVITQSQTTASLDAQVRRRFITVEKNYSNPNGLECGVLYNISDDVVLTPFEKAEVDTKEKYIKETKKIKKNG